MTKAEFYAEFERALEAPKGSIQGNENLTDLVGWDSMASLSLIALVDAKLGLNLAGRDIQACKTVADVVQLCGDKLL